jgi:hypothetical protein
MGRSDDEEFMIDTKTGNITIEGLAEPIGAHTKLKRFLELAGFEKSTGGSSPMSSYALGVRRIADRRFYVLVAFHGDVLETIEFALDGSEVAVPVGTSETDAELVRHDLQKRWLRSLLGPPTHPSSVGNDSHSLPMGGIGSCYDPRNFSSSIVARYRWLGKPWTQG